MSRLDLDSDYREMFIIWLRYTIDCDAFDRTLPGFDVGYGEWYPAGDMKTSRLYAKSRRDQALEELRRCGYDRTDWEAAKLEAFGIRESRRQEVLDSIL